MSSLFRLTTSEIGQKAKLTARNDHDPRTEKPIGTHLFIAVPKETAGNAPDRGLRWLVLTLPEGVPNEDERGARRGGRVNVAAPAKVAPPTASEALDRIEMPDEVAEKLSEMLWAGAALIVSAHAILLAARRVGGVAGFTNRPSAASIAAMPISLGSRRPALPFHELCMPR